MLMFIKSCYDDNNDVGKGCGNNSTSSVDILIECIFNQFNCVKRSKKNWIIILMKIPDRANEWEQLPGLLNWLCAKANECC